MPENEELVKALNYAPLIVITVKAILTLILALLTLKCYNLHFKFIKQYKSNILAYKETYCSEIVKMLEDSKNYPELITNANSIDSQLSASRGSPTTESLKQIVDIINIEKQNHTEIINKQVEFIDKEEEKIKIECSTLLKEIVPLLSAISLLWIGKSF